MGFCCELREGPMGCHIRNTVNIGFCHYFLFGCFIICFVYSNQCYPEPCLVDHMFGGCGAALMVVVLIGILFAHRDACQPIRCSFGFFITVNLILLTLSCHYYTIERWYDVVVTVLVQNLRTPVYKDFPDYLWRSLAVLSCINCFICFFYLPYILSFMCNKRKLYLFTRVTRNVDLTAFSQFTIPNAPSVPSAPSAPSGPSRPNTRPTYR